MKNISLLSVLLLISCSTQKTDRVWQSIEQGLQTQLISISNGDTLDLPEGNFMFTKSLAMDGKSDIVIRGKGIDKTVLSFKNQTEGAQGLLISNGKNIVLQDFSIEDAIEFDRLRSMPRQESKLVLKNENYYKFKTT